jgi:hypothetical protein
MRILKVNELNKSSYLKASNKLKQMGHLRRSFELDKWSFQRSGGLLEGPFKVIKSSDDDDVKEVLIETELYIFDVYSKNSPINYNEQEEEEYEDEDEYNYDDFFITGDDITNEGLEDDLKRSSNWAQKLLSDTRYTEVEDRIFSLTLQISCFEFSPKDYKKYIKDFIEFTFDVNLIYKKGESGFKISFSKQSEKFGFYFVDRKEAIRFLKQLKEINILKILKIQFERDDREVNDFLYEYGLLNMIKKQVTSIPINKLYRD